MTLRRSCLARQLLLLPRGRLRRLHLLLLLLLLPHLLLLLLQLQLPKQILHLLPVHLLLLPSRLPLPSPLLLLALFLRVNFSPVLDLVLPPGWQPLSLLSALGVIS